MKVRRAHLASLVSLSVILTASTAAGQVRLHAPGQRQGYVVTDSGSVKVRPYSASTQAIGWQFGMAPGGGATYDLRHLTGTNPQLRFSATANDNAAATTEPSFPTYGAGVDGELRRPGGVLDPSTFFFPQQGLNAVRTAGNRYIVAFVADGKTAATVVELEGAADGSRLTVGSARLEAIAGPTVTNQLVGPGFNSKYVVIGGASKTSIIGYSNSNGIGAVVAQVDNPTGYQYLSAGPAVGDPDRLWVAAVRASDRVVKLFPLLTTGYRESEAIDVQLTLAGTGATADRLVPAFDGAGKCVLVAYRGTTGSFSRKTSVRVVDLGLKSLVAGATRDDGPDFSQQTFPPPVTATATGVYLVGKAAGDASAALYSVSTTAGTLSKVTLSGGSFGADEPTSLLAEAPLVPTTTRISDAAASVAAGQPAVFTVTRSATSTDSVTVTYQTVDGTALSGTDYTAVASGSVVFEPGTLTKTVNVATIVPSTCKAERTFKVRLTGAFATNSPKAEGSATILGDSGCATAVVSGGGGVCRGGSATMTATFAGAAGPWIVIWSDGVQVTYSTSPATRSVSPQATTTYTITSLTSQGKQGAASGSATVSVVDASQPPRVTVKEALAPTEQAAATVTGEAGIAFTWEAQENGVAAPGVISGGQGTYQATIRPTKEGILTLKATRSGAGCGGTSEVKIVVASTGAPKLLLQDGQVSVQVAWRHESLPDGGIAASVELDPSVKQTLGSFHFGDESNPELFVKVLDFGNRYPVFYGGLTTFEYIVTFSVTAPGGQTKRYFKAAGNTTDAGGTQLPKPGGRAGSEGAYDYGAEEARAALSGESTNLLTLSNGRVVVALTYWDKADPAQTALSSARALPIGDAFGYYYYPEPKGGPSSPELFVKVLDRTGEAADKPYALFFTGLTTFEYHTTFVNAQTGQVLTFDKSFGAYAGGVDTNLRVTRASIPNAATAVPEIQLEQADGSLAPRDAKGYWQVSAGVPMTFSAPTAGGSPAWDFGDGATSTSTSPSHTFSGSGLIVVQLSAGSGRSAAIVQIGSCPTVSLSPSSLAKGTIGQSYKQSVTASGGTAPYSYSVTAGTLPAGLALDFGAISGTPTAEGRSTFTVTARDANGCTGSQSYTIEIGTVTIPTCTGFSISPTSTNATSAGGSGLVSVTGTLPSGCEGGSWTASASGSGFVEVSPLGGSGNGVVTVFWTQNTSTASRSASATIAGNAFTVNQDGPIPALTCTTFSISPTSASSNDQAGSALVTVVGISPAGCQGGSWTAFENNSWLTVSPFSGTGNGSVTVSWTRNLSSARTGSATIAGNSFAVSQGGAPVPACTNFSISPTSASATAASGSAPVSVTATAPPGCQGGSWAASGNGSWVTVSPTSGTGNGTVTVSWEVNSGAARSANGTIAGTSFAVNQAAPVTPCTGVVISISPGTLPSGKIGQTYQQNLTITGGEPPRYIAVTSGGFPPGLQLVGATIIGDPTTPGSYPVTVTVTDTNGCKGSQSYTIVITP